MTCSCPVCGTMNHDNRRKCTARDCRHPGGHASAWKNSGKDARNSRRAPSSSASRRWTCQACSYETYAWRAYCHSCNQAVGSVCRVGSGGSSQFLSAECDRLRGGSESPGSDAMLIEEDASAKTEEQDRLTALDTSIVNLEKARGGKLDVAIDEVLRQKWQERQDAVLQVDQGSPQNGNCGTGEGGHQAQGSANEQIDLKPLLLLKQQEIADAKNDCGGSVSHGSSASFSSPMSPQQWALGLVAFESSSRGGIPTSISRTRHPWTFFWRF